MLQGNEYDGTSKAIALSCEGWGAERESYVHWNLCKFLFQYCNRKQVHKFGKLLCPFYILAQP